MASTTGDKLTSIFPEGTIGNVDVRVTGGHVLPVVKKDTKINGKQYKAGDIVLMEDLQSVPKDKRPDVFGKQWVWTGRVNLNRMFNREEYQFEEKNGNLMIGDDNPREIKTRDNGEKYVNIGGKEYTIEQTEEGKYKLQNVEDVLGGSEQTVYIPRTDNSTNRSVEGMLIQAPPEVRNEYYKYQYGMMPYNITEGEPEYKQPEQPQDEVEVQGQEDKQDQEAIPWFGGSNNNKKKQKAGAY